MSSRHAQRVRRPVECAQIYLTLHEGCTPSCTRATYLTVLNLNLKLNANLLIAQTVWHTRQVAFTSAVGLIDLYSESLLPLFYI